MVRRAARIYCCIIAAFTFDAGPNKQIFVAITNVAATFVPCLNCARSSGPSFTKKSVATYVLSPLSGELEGSKD